MLLLPLPLLLLRMPSVLLLRLLPPLAHTVNDGIVCGCQMQS